MRSLAFLLLWAVKAHEGHALVDPLFDPKAELPSLNPELIQAQARNNFTGFFSVKDNLLVMNKTATANTVGWYLASAFLAYTLYYTYETNNPSTESKIGSVLTSFLPTLEKSSDKSKAEKTCDCETYCTNKYYYGDGNYNAEYTEGENYSDYYRKRR